MKSALCLLTLFVAVTHSAASQCKWGPSFWCQNEATAKQCGQLTYCQTTVWKITEQVKQPEDAECDLCEMVVDLVEKYINENNKTEDDVEKLIKEVCSKLGGFAEECDALVDQYFPLIWELVDKEAPGEICSLIGLCGTKLTAEKLPKRTPVSKPEGLECDFCKYVVDEAVKLAKENKSEQYVKDALDDFCSSLGHLEAECKSLINTYFDMIWDAILDGLTAEEICGKIGLCSASVLLAPKVGFCDACKDIAEFLQTYADSNATEEEVKKVFELFCNIFPEVADQCNEILNNFGEYWELFKGEVDGDTFCYQFDICASKKKIQTRTVPKKEGQALCDLCNKVADLLKPYVDNPDDEAEAKAVLEDFCNALPDEDKDQCNNLLNEYFPVIWDLLKSEIDDGEICKMIGLCTSVKIQTRTKPKKEEQSLCDDCKIAVDFLKTYIDQNATEEEVKDLLEAICGFLPSNDSKQCLEYVNEYFPVLWELLKQEVDSGDFCMLIGFCPSTKVAVEKVKVTTPKTIKCEACQAIVKMLRPIVDSTTVEGIVETDLKFICDRLPSQYKTECKNFIDQDYQLLWAVFRDEVDDGELCGLLKFCTSATLPKVEVAVGKQASKTPEIPGLCQICELIVEEFENKLFTNSSEAYLLGELNKLCDDAPVEWRKECKDFVEEYGEEIIKLVLEGVGPKLVCTAIRACSLVTETETFSFDSMSETDCEVCQMVIGYIKNFIGDNFTEGVVVDALEKVCTVLPAPLEAECSAFVKEYGAQVVQLIVEGIDPKEICQKIDLCPKLSGSDLTSPWKKIERAFTRV